MRAVRFEQYGGIDQLQISEVEDPTPGDGQLLVRVMAAAINPGEAKIREGKMHAMFPATFPSGEGTDLAGVVEAVGSNVTEFQAGDEVIGYTYDRASHAELALVQQSRTIPKPADVSWEVGGSLFVAGSTGYAMVAAVGLEAGDTVIVAGATGGVGALAVQLAKQVGATVVGIASSRNADWLTAHGVIPVEYPADGDLDALEQRIRELVPDDSRLALLDCHGPTYIELARRLQIPPDRVDTIVRSPEAAAAGVKMDGSAAADTTEILSELAAQIARGQLEIPIAATFPLDQVREAYTSLKDDHPLGKIVLIP